MKIIWWHEKNKGYRLQFTVYRLQVTGYRLQFTGYRLQVLNKEANLSLVGKFE